MWSGGLDSTGVLYKLLTESKELLHVHHIDIQNAEKRSIPEKYAVANISKIFKQIRDFKFTTNTYEFLQFQNFITWDNDLVRFVAAQVCKDNQEIKKVALGKCADDENPAFKVRALQAMALWNACFIDTAKPAPEVIRPVEHMTKKEIWEMLPEQIRKSTWSCRTPIRADNVFSYCLKCHTCQNFIKYGLIKGPV